MRKIIKGWKHIPGIHCGSVSLRDVISYHGVEMSEAMCFGLGSGLGFFYSIDEEMSPTRNIHLRGPNMEPNFFRHFQDKSGWEYDDDRENALKTLIYYLKNDVPVILQTDIYYLDYYKSNTHFPGHVVVACGYDDIEETVFLSDTGYEDVLSVSYEELKDSRTSKAKPYPLSNNWMVAESSIGKIDLGIAIPRALKTNAVSMLQGTQSIRGHSGVEYINKLAMDITNWSYIQDWRWCVRYSYQVIQKRGTCGGGFRWMYRDFLYEAQQYAEFIKRNDLADKMDQIGRLWFEVSNYFKSISELEHPGDSLEEASSRIHDIYGQEKDFYTRIININI